MSEKNRSLELFFNIAKTQAVMSRRFDNGLGGLGYNEFIILCYLDQAENSKMSRIELSDKLGVTASGITRILLPMEKVGLVNKEIDPDDARISLVVLAGGGKRRLAEALERAELIVDTLLDNVKPQKLAELNTLIAELGEKALKRY